METTERGFANILAVLVLVAVLGLGGYAYYHQTPAPAGSVDGGVACTKEAKACPDGSYVGRQGPKCEFAACPSVATDETATWLTFSDPTQGVSFKYPATLGTKYIRAEVWPPKITVKDGTFSCQEGRNNGATGWITSRQTATSPIFCVAQTGDAAMGSAYHQYTYTAFYNGKLLSFAFTLAEPNACGPITGADHAACVTEENSYDLTNSSVKLDNLVAQILSTLRFTAPQASADTSGWKTYGNAQYSFEFKYPPSFAINPHYEGSKAIDSFTTNKLGNGTTFVVTKISDSAADYQQKLMSHTYYDGSGLSPKTFDSFQKLTVGENEFYFIKTGAFEGVASLSYFLVSPRGIYQFSLSHCCVDWTNPSVDTSANPGHEVLKQILSTFRFTELPH